MAEVHLYLICNKFKYAIFKFKPKISHNKNAIFKFKRERGYLFIDNKSKDSNFTFYFNMQVENFHRDAHCVENEKILGAHPQVIFLT